MALFARIALATPHIAHCLFALRCFCVCFCAVAMHWHWQILPFVHPQAEQRCQGQPCAATPPAHRRRGQCQGERYVRGLHDAHSCAQASSLTPRSQSQNTACSTVTLSYINAALQLHRCEMMGIYGTTAPRSLVSCGLHGGASWAGFEGHDDRPHEAVAVSGDSDSWPHRRCAIEESPCRPWVSSPPGLGADSNAEIVVPTGTKQPQLWVAISRSTVAM
jgi:hypothetical protein